MNQDLNQYVINDRSHKYLNARLELFCSDLIVALIQCNAAFFLASLEASNSNGSLILKQTHSKFEITSELQNFDHFG